MSASTSSAAISAGHLVCPEGGVEHRINLLQSLTFNRMSNLTNCFLYRSI